MEGIFVNPRPTSGPNPLAVSTTPLQIQCRTAWPTLLFHIQWQDAAKWHPGMIEKLYALKAGEKTNIASGVAMSAKPEEGLFESRMDLLDAPQDDCLIALKVFFQQSVAAVVSKVNGDRVPAHQLVVDVKDSWFHITNDGGFHDAHYHGGCSWCGIYYIRAGDVPERQPAHAPNGVNRFYSPIRIGAMQDDYGNDYLSANSTDVPPKDGMLILFPSFLLHSALPYRGSVDRLVVAFNSTTRIRTKD